MLYLVKHHEMSQWVLYLFFTTSSGAPLNGAKVKLKHRTQILDKTWEKILSCILFLLFELYR